MHVEVNSVYGAGVKHHYVSKLRWDGDPQIGTTSYADYDRQFRLAISGKPDLVGSANRVFRGDPALHDPEDLFLASIASCHMLSYLALCARAAINVVAYADDVRGVLVTQPDGGGKFERVDLAPSVQLAPGADVARALAFHDRAHQTCFIASSCGVPIHCDPTVTIASEPGRARRPRQDLAVRLDHRAGALAELGETLGRAGVSLEGGGGFVVGDDCLVHVLVDDADTAIAALRACGIVVVGVRDVLEARLAQGEPGQLGKFARALANANVNIDCVYSDHEHRLIVAVDDLAAGRRVVETWRAAPAMEGIAHAASPADLAYVRREFATLEELARDRGISLEVLRSWAGVHLPSATYMMPDGELRYARDWWRLYDEAGDAAAVRALFERRYLACGGEDLDDEWAAYRAGLYGACLHEVTPEHIVAKSKLVERLERALAAPRSDDLAWRRELRTDVAALDALVRPFAECDRERFRRPTSRERLIELPRRELASVFLGVG